MRIFVLTATYELRVIRKNHLRDHPTPDPDPDHPITKKNCRKTLIRTVLWILYDFSSKKNDVNKCTFKKYKHKNLEIVFSWRIDGQERK